MPHFKVTILGMQEISYQFHLLSEGFVSAANRMFSGAQALSAAFEGTSQEAFQSAMEDAYRWYKKMYALVEANDNSLHKTAAAYARVDAAARAAVGAGSGVGDVYGTVKLPDMYQMSSDS